MLAINTPTVLRSRHTPAGLMASTPLFLWDHVAAVVFWVALYGLEVALILSVYKRYPDSEQAVSRAAAAAVART